jgi:hypothetical protein
MGTPIEPRNVNRRWDELRQRADLDGLRLHDLRHGCATFLLAQGVPARAIMDVLGHAEIGATMNTYAHVLPVLRQEAAEPSRNCSGRGMSGTRDMSGFGNSIGNRKKATSCSQVAADLGALGGLEPPTF